MQGALAVKEIGPEHRDPHCRVTQLETCHAGNELAWYKGLIKGFADDSHVPEE
jgi:hypothetical protein